MNLDQELAKINIELSKNPSSQNLKNLKATLLNNKALHLSHQNKIGEAIKFVNQAIELNPDIHATLYCNKANFLHKANKNSEALEAANKALELDSDNHKAKDVIVLCLNNQQAIDCEKGNYADGLGKIEKALELKPNEIMLLCNKALVLNYLEKYEEAVEVADKCLAMDERFHNAKVVKASILHKLSMNDFEKDEYEAALEKINQAIELKSNEATYLINKCSCLIKLKRNKEALEFAEKALALEKTNKDAVYLKSLAAKYLKEEK